MTDLTPAERRYSDREVARILERASELQEDAPDDAETTGMSLADLELVAREAGLDPALIRRAAADIEHRRIAERSSTFFGSPTTLRLERTIDGEISVDEYEPIVAEIHRILGEVGHASTLGRTLQWSTRRSSRRLTDVREVRVTISPRNARTTIAVEEPLRAVAAAVFGGVMGLGGVLALPLMAVGVNVFGSGTAALGIFAGTLAGSYLLARAILGRVAARRRSRLATLMQYLETHVDATATSSRLPPHPDGRDLLGQGG